MNRNTSKGFTLIELLITVAVFVVLVGLGVPSFVSAIKNTKLTGDFTPLISALYLARSEAVKRSSSLTVCARASDNSCGDDWNNGWLVFTDNIQGAAGGVAGKVDANDAVLSVSPPLDGRSLEAAGSLAPNTNSVSNTAARDFITYSSTGGNNWSGGTFVMCDDRGEEHALTVNLAITGDIRKGRTKGGDIPVDVLGIDITCP